MYFALKTMIATGTVVLIAGLSGMALSGQFDRKTVADPSQTSMRTAIQARVDLLHGNGCVRQAEEIRSFHGRHPLTSLNDLPKRLREDIMLCYQRGIMYAFVRDDLKDAGLEPLLNPARLQ